MPEKELPDNWEEMLSAIKMIKEEEKTEAQKIISILNNCDSTEILTWLLDNKPEIYDMVSGVKRRDHLLLLIYQILTRVTGIDRPTGNLSLEELTTKVKIEQGTKAKILKNLIQLDATQIITWLIDNNKWGIHDQINGLNIQRRDHLLLFIWENL